MNEAYFAGGCFWCITPVFRETPGVCSVMAGYAGGTEPNPTYEDVKHGKTHHRETIRIAYDPNQVSYSALLNTFLWSVDPFDRCGQFIDRGPSYTLAVYYLDEEQRTAALAAIETLQETDSRPVCIALEPFTGFYPAEKFHQDYDLKNPLAFAREMALSGRKTAR
ncbi:MAG: peptide-methionine (S)-S-oxide reductase MsrA [Clostridia bacterium]|nr:peptide-methionine (S)-S-oxide reductase MsrA [Clostridia bacterium]